MKYMIVEQIKHKVHYVCLIMFMALFLQGCSSNGIAVEQAKEVADKGRPILEEYVSSLPEEAHITNISMLNGCGQGEPSFNAKFPSHVVQATFVVGDKHYTAVVNIEDGEIYSNYNYVDPNELIAGQLTKYCDECGFKGTYRVTGAFYSYVFVSHQVEVSKGNIRDTYVYIDNIPDLAPAENAVDFLNASISGFDIEYESLYDEVFKPEILYNYLSDTNNYRKENMRGDNREYHINGGRREQNYVDGEPSYYEISIKSEGDPDTMMCDVLRWDYKEDNDFCYLYAGGVKNGNIKNIETEEYVQYDCPFVLSGNELTYTKNDNSPYEEYLYVKKTEWNDIEMTRYGLSNKSSDEKTNDIVDKWELELLGSEALEIGKSDLAGLYELYIKGTENRCRFTDDKAVVVFR